MVPSILVTSLLLLHVGNVNAFGVKERVSTLLQKHVSDIARMKEETQAMVGSIDSAPYNNDLFYLRYCLAEKGIDDLKETLTWRQGKGREICEAAVTAFEKATADGKWDNTPVRDGAPNANLINKYITPSTCLTTSSSEGDLVYCIRAGLIDDTALMGSLSSVDQLVDFFLYCKEVNSLVANDRSLEMNKVLYVVTANDLKAVQLIGGDSSFRDALSAASKQANPMYPELNGPTLLLNLPRLVSALVKLFTPLFPAEVQARLKFERGPLSKVDELLDISHGGKDRNEFLKELDRLCYE
eukprot:scaffold4916_cov111-Cylindrotheca_fusiformis.AAC.1